MGGQLRLYPPVSPARSAASNHGDAPTSAPPTKHLTDVDPKPGRLCVFFAQEMEHEVLRSEGERFAITLWIWSTAKDDRGR